MWGRVSRWGTAKGTTVGKAVGGSGRGSGNNQALVFSEIEPKNRLPTAWSTRPGEFIFHAAKLVFALRGLRLLLVSRKSSE
jgi:hypothetical protein